MARVYASSPVAQPADHTRIRSFRPFDATSAGTTSCSRNDHASVSRKKPVTFTRMVLKRAANSSGWTSRKSAYSASESMPTSFIRWRTRRSRLGRLYPVKSKPRSSRRNPRSASRSAELMRHPG